jgi:hypothetical protein
MAATLDPGVSRSDTALRRLIGGGRVLLGIVIALAGVIAGVGWLYILRQFDPLGHGPLVDGALPLQQLAGGDAQPLARLLVAWIPVGLGTGLALARATRLGRVARLVVVAIVALAALWLAGAAADAITVNQRFTAHFWEQQARTGIWLGTALLSLAAALPRTAGRRDSAAGTEGAHRHALPNPLISVASRRRSW